MENIRKYGIAPFNVVVIHGGPGAWGEMAPVARELASGWGVLEPLQTATSIKGQIEELKTVLEKNGEHPVTLIGFSWGAWLSFLFAAMYPVFTKKLILIGSGPFEEKYAATLQKTRLNRLSEKKKTEVESLLNIINSPEAEDKNKALARLGALYSKVDAYDPITDESDTIDCQTDIFQSVWKEAAELRKSGQLLKLGKHIECPVVAIHGDYDPHPHEGVRKPLSAILDSFRFILLRNCGHKPWIEREVREELFRILNEELR